MRSRLVALVAVTAFVSPAAADPLRAAMHLAQVGAGGPGAPPPTPTTPAATTAPMLADVVGEPTEVTLPQLLQLAVRQAPALAQAKVDLEIAEAQVDSARAWADWAIGARLAGSHNASASSSSDSIDLSGSLSRALSTGGVAEVDVAGGWGKNSTVRTVQLPGMDPITTTLENAGYTDSVTLSYTQPLLRGRGSTQVLAAQRQAAKSLDASQLAGRAAAITVVQNVVLGYFDLVAAEQALDIRRQSLGLAQEQLRVTQAGVTGGGVAKAETIPVEQAIATREGEVLGAELDVLNASLSLRRLVGMPIGPGEMLLTTKTDLAIPAKSWDQKALIETALASSPDLARLAAQDAGATIEIETTENGILPSLDLALSFGPSGSSIDPESPTKAAYRMVTFSEVQAGASLTYSTTWGQIAARASARKARASRETIRVSQIDLKAQIVQAVATSVANVQVAERRFALATRAADLADQNVKVEQSRVALGKSRNVDVMIRQDDLRNAQLQVAQAIVSWHKAATLLAALTGEILPDYGIDLDLKLAAGR